MALRSLLFHVDPGAKAKARADVALHLAEQHDAHVIALAPTGAPVMPGYMSGGLPMEIIQTQERQAEERAREAAEKFRELAKRRGVSHEIRVERCSDLRRSAIIGLHARYSDLVVLGQADPDEPSGGALNLVEDVVLSCGRPAVVVPYVGAKTMPGKDIMVAWDAGREAARAVQDALPLLEKADKVTILVVNADKSDSPHGEEPGADIAAHLARHGVKAHVQRTSAPDISVGEEILSRLADANSDMLVMGAYGHSRWRELVLGGATRSLLAEMTVPVFMSH